jgi:geranylgeranyl diphosphate synthase, type II
MDFKSRYDYYLEMVNRKLEELVREKEMPEKTLYSAMKYSLMAGGKRLRPVLALAVCDMLDERPEQILPFGCAIELIHTYSLIHDDLPAMDNDDYRRGSLTNHKVYGEAMAILAGDALLNLAFESMLAYTLQTGDKLLEKVRAMEYIAGAAGAAGMIGGQVVDLESEGRSIPAELLDYMHRCKTGALIKAPVMAAAFLCRTEKKETAHLETFADRLGLAFQIKDDLLDVEGSLEAMGKRTGSDTANDKTTFITLYGVERSREMLEEITCQAIDSLALFGEKAEFLVALSQYLVGRKN